MEGEKQKERVEREMDGGGHCFMDLGELHRDA